MAHPVKKFRYVYGTQEFITANTKPQDIFINQANDIVTQAKVLEVSNFLNISGSNLEMFVVSSMLATSHCCLQFFALLMFENVNPLNPELNPICYLLALLAHHFLHVSRIRVKVLTFRLLMSYIYGAHILDVSRSHTTTQHSR